MRIGVVSDPHGCLVGLAASLDWLEADGVDMVVCAGDVASFGPQPNECVSLLAERDIATVQGNSDRDILLPPLKVPENDERAAQIITIDNWCKARLNSHSQEWLAALPQLLMPSPDVLIVHGGLGNPDEIVKSDAKPIFPPEVSIVAAGHLHVPFINDTDESIWVNAGSVGRSCDGDARAAVAILTLGSSGWDASIHRIDFYLPAAERAIRASNIPFAERMIETQRNACWW